MEREVMINQMAEEILIKRVVSPQEMKDVFRLRYRVYCLERGYEKPDDHSNGLEIDEYDPYSIHFIASVRSLPVGTVRLILPNSIGFPLESYCNVEVKTVFQDASRVAEISRLAVSTDVRKRCSIQRSLVTLGLLRELYQSAKQNKIRFLLAAMSSGLDRLLQRCGMRFIKLGDPVDYHGIRTPYFAHMDHLEKEVFTRRKDIYEFFFPFSEYSRNLENPHCHILRGTLNTPLTDLKGEELPKKLLSGSPIMC